jgi:hypothetical protein
MDIIYKKYCRKEEQGTEVCAYCNGEGVLGYLIRPWNHKDNPANKKKKSKRTNDN